MENNETVVTGGYEYNKILEYIMGGILITVFIFGSTANLLAFRYFKNMPAKNTTSMYFRRMYLSISVNDLCLCLVVLPSIEACFSEGRQGTMFTNHVFCSSWLALWTGLYFTSIILLAMLSMSRLLVIIKRTITLIPLLGTLIHVLLVTAGVLTVAAMTLDHRFFPLYSSNQLRCFVSTFPSSPGGNSTANASDHLKIMEAKRKLFAIGSISALCFLAICLSFTLSLIYLRKAKKHSKKVQGSVKEQNAAAKTVIIVTLLYIVFNTPAMMISFYKFYDWFVVPSTHDTQFASSAEFAERASDRMFGQHEFLNQYAIPVTVVIATSLNSFANPIVYWSRMAGFRAHIRDLAPLRRRSHTMSQGDGQLTQETQSRDGNVIEMNHVINEVE